MSPIIKWLRELSVVITGIVLTIGIGYFVNKKNAEEELKQYLSAIKVELEENAAHLDWYAGIWRKSVRYYEYLKANDKKSLNKDSLDYYAVTTISDNPNIDGYGLGYMVTYYPAKTMTNAFEAFKISGDMRLIKNKELLTNIWAAYTALENFNLRLEKVFKVKEEEAIRELQLEAEGNPVAVPMQVFYNTDFALGILRQSIDLSEELKIVATMIETAL
jgi:hypothetical protein